MDTFIAALAYFGIMTLVSVSYIRKGWKKKKPLRRGDFVGEVIGAFFLGILCVNCFRESLVAGFAGIILIKAYYRHEMGRRLYDMRVSESTLWSMALLSETGIPTLMTMFMKRMEPKPVVPKSTNAIGPRRHRSGISERLTDLKTKFEIWYRALSGPELVVFVISSAVILWILVMNNPLAGYHKSIYSPWWWVYGYPSNTYSAWLTDQVYRTDHLPATPFYRFKTLGGVLGFLILAPFMTKTILWLVRLRKAGN